MKRKSSTQALGMHYIPAREGEVRFGADVALGGLYQAVLAHGDLERYEIYARPYEHEYVSEMVRKSVGRNAGRMRVHPFRTLVNQSYEPPVTAWFDAGFADIESMTLLRKRRSRGVFPITFTHYTVSWVKQLRDWYLPLVTEDLLPCDSLVCTSRATRKSMMRLMDVLGEEFARRDGSRPRYRGRLDVIPLAVDTGLLRPRNKREIRAKLNMPANAFVIAWVGRLSAMDKADLLPTLRVFRRLVDDNPRRDLRLLIAGTPVGRYADVLGHYAAALGIRDRMSLLRELPAAERYLPHAAADVFVSPADNIQETFGLTPVEAMACGVPQVVADWDGYRDTVLDGETGFLVPTQWMKCDADLAGMASVSNSYAWQHAVLAQSVVVDFDAYRKSLQTLIDSEDLRRKMGAASRKRALSLFSLPAVAAQYEALWRELAIIAGRTKYPAARRNRGYLETSFYDAFANYAATELAASVSIALTDGGHELLRSSEGLPHYDPQTELLDRDLLWCCLNELKSRPKPLGQVALRLAGKQKHEHHVRRHLLWLMKYGFVEIKNALDRRKNKERRNG